MMLDHLAEWNWEAIGQWVIILGSIASFSYYKIRYEAKQEAKINGISIRLDVIESVQSTNNSFILRTDTAIQYIKDNHINWENFTPIKTCDNRFESVHNELISIATDQRANISRLHERLDLIGKDDSVDKITGDISKIFSQTAKLEGSMEGVQKSLETVVAHILNKNT